MEPAEDFRRKAERCMKMAQIAVSDGMSAVQMHWIDMAQHWLELARLAETSHSLTFPEAVRVPRLHRPDPCCET